ncbi:hypothetical protein [Candidatus Oscillochloris fontis]|nr:hypothetical protein [Candidatus Oscillochloris fontis]
MILIIAIAFILLLAAMVVASLLNFEPARVPVRIDDVERLRRRYRR